MGLGDLGDGMRSGLLWRLGVNRGLVVGSDWIRLLADSKILS